MRSKLYSLEIKKLIIHEVPKRMRNEEGGSPIYSEIESPMDDELLFFFKEKIIGGIGSNNAFDVVYEPSSPSPVGEYLMRYFNGETTDFIKVSQKIAEHLYNCQTGINPGGLLAVIECEIDKENAIAILKVEKEEGVRLNQEIIDGKRTFDIKLIKDLLFTKKTKLYKIGLFYTLPNTDQTIQGIVSDHQRGYQATNEIALFFLDKFLGCKLLDDPVITTKHFYEATEEFINKEIDNPALKALTHTHLISELSNQRTVINPDNFASDYLPTRLRRKFIESLNERGIPTHSFNKKLDLIEPKIKRKAIEFESGIQVVGKYDAINNNVKLSEVEEGKTKLELIDKLKRVISK